MNKLILLTITTVLAGCSVHDTPHAKNMGITVDHMVRQQTYDLEAATTNKVEVVDETNGERAGNAIKTYREDAPDQDRVTEPLRIEIIQ